MKKNPINTLFKIMGSLPLPVLYGFSGFIAFLAGNIVGYRRKVIRDNLTRCFPEKNKKELRKIERGFYRFLADYFVETLRLGRMSKAEVMKRMRFEGMDEVNKELENGRDVTLYLGHYCNWEWLSSIPLHSTTDALKGQIYHPLENKTADEAFLNIRNRFGATSIPMNDTLPVLRENRRKGKNSIIGYIADQSPNFHGIHYFANFFNRETAAFTGPERLSRMLHATVFYCDLSRPKRGEYVCRFVRMTDDAALLPQFELTQKYFDMLEESIRRQPELWLWSHKRWKRSKEDLIREYGEEEVRKRLSRL